MHLKNKFLKRGGILTMDWIQCNSIATQIIECNGHSNVLPQ